MLTFMMLLSLELQLGTHLPIMAKIASRWGVLVDSRGM